MNWITFTVLAAFMQSVRTAGQKKMGHTYSPMANTFVRFSFGLPFALLYLGVLVVPHSPRELTFSPSFFIYASLAGLCQIMGTMLQVRLLGIRNFASGTVFVKSDVILTALIGFSFFDDILGARSWIGIFVCTVGIFSLGRSKQQRRGFHFLPILLGTGAGLGFALASLFIRRASLSLNAEVTISAAVCLVMVLTLQSAILAIYLTFFDPRQWPVILHHKKESIFIGFTSVGGSVGWYTAMTITQASFVRALGQVEVIMAIMITFLFFREKPRLAEWIGLLLVTAGVLLTIL